MKTLSKNATVEQYQDYYDSLEPDKQAQFRKAGILNIINQTYTDGADDLIEDATPESGSIVSGVFIDRRAGSPTRQFRFKITSSGGEFNLEYRPVNRAAIA